MRTTLARASGLPLGSSVAPQMVTGVVFASGLASYALANISGRCVCGGREHSVAEAATAGAVRGQGHARGTP